MKKNSLAYQAYYRYIDAASSTNGQGSRERLREAWKMYAGIYNGQWKPEVVAQLEAATIPIHTYNFVQGAVDTVKGHLLQSPIDARISTRVPGDTEEVSAMQTLLEIDMKMSKFEKQEATVLRDGLIQEGVMQLYVDFTDDLRGQIKFRAIDPNYITWSPAWITEDIADCEEAFRSEWLSAQQIKAIYNKKSEELDDAIRLAEQANSSSNWINDEDRIIDRSPEYFDRNRDKYRVIERIWIKEETERVVIDLWSGQEVKKRPKAIPAEVEVEDAVMEVALNAESSAESGEKDTRYVVRRKRIRKCYVTTVCPAISFELELAHGEYPLQCGQLPFAVWAMGSAHGERWGLPEILKDPQRVLNIRNSQITKALNNKINGSYKVESDAFDSAEGLTDFKKNANKSGKVHVLAPGANQAQKILPLNDGLDTSDLTQSLGTTMEMIKSLVQVVPLMQAQKQVGHDSGVLYEATRTDALVPFETLLDSYKTFKQCLIELYIKAAVDWYGTAPRLFFDTDRGVQVALNTPVPNPQTGEVEIVTLKDAKWYQTEMVMLRVGNARKVELIGQYGMLLKSTDIPAVRGALQLQIVELIDFPEEVKSMLRKQINDYISNQAAIQAAQTAEADAKAKQAEMATQPQPQAQPGAQAPQPGFMEQMAAQLGGAGG